MKTSPIIKYTLIVLIFIVISCLPARITLNILEPARITIPSSITRVSLFPGAGIPDEPGMVDSINHIELEPGFDYNRIKRAYMLGMYETMTASPRFLKVVRADSSYAEFLASGLISWDELRQICLHDSTDAVLVLNKAVSRDTLVRYNVPAIWCGMAYRLINSTQWTFYQPFLHDQMMKISYTDTSIFEQEDPACDPHSELLGVNDVLFEAFYNSGARVAEEIGPTWHNDIQRFLFTGPGSQLWKASSFALSNQWDEAAAIWNVLADHRNRTIASHASYNMAVAWEQNDDLDQAELWIAHADSLLSSGSTIAYKKIIQTRLQNRALLDQQMDRY